MAKSGAFTGKILPTVLFRCDCSLCTSHCHGSCSLLSKTKPHRGSLALCAASTHELRVFTPTGLQRISFGDEPAHEAGAAPEQRSQWEEQQPGWWQGTLLGGSVAWLQDRGWLWGQKAGEAGSNLVAVSSGAVIRTGRCAVESWQLSEESFELIQMTQRCLQGLRHAPRVEQEGVWGGKQLWAGFGSLWWVMALLSMAFCPLSNQSCSAHSRVIRAQQHHV